MEIETQGRGNQFSSVIVNDFKLSSSQAAVELNLKSAIANKKEINLTILVCALGYFVDIYDLLLFGIVRIPSLKALGVPQEKLLSVGIHLINMQMFGMLLGGIIWGVLGDKIGRKQVLFGSILMYSVANICNAFVTGTESYAYLRFFAGIGLAGELGAAVTLVSEIMSKESRGYGTSIVAAVGILGAVVASLVGDAFDWKIAYIVGGVMGLCLLVMRAKLLESKMFDDTKKTNVARGAFIKIFTSKELLVKYLRCIAIGVPLWFVVGILVTFSPELTKDLGISGVTASKAIMWTYLGLSIGDLASGLFSQWIRSRKRAVLVFLSVTAAFAGFYQIFHGRSANDFYLLCVAMGLGAGYWAVFVTNAAEQFGTNLRATVATTVPNFVRGAVVPMTLGFNYLRPSFGGLHSAAIVGGVAFAIAFLAVWKMDETFGKPLDYNEKI